MWNKRASYVWWRLSVYNRVIWRFARQRPVAALWSLVVVLLVIMSIAAPLIAPYDPLAPDFKKIAQQPTWSNLFGTDFLGRDQLSRIIYAGRVSLFVAVMATLVGVGLG